MTTDSPTVLANIVRAYAALRGQYLHGVTAEDFNAPHVTANDQHMLMEQAGLEKAADIVQAQGTYDSVELGLPSWIDEDDWNAAVARQREQNRPYIAAPDEQICNSCRSVVAYVPTSDSDTTKCPECGAFDTTMNFGNVSITADSVTVDGVPWTPPS